ncbi:MAG: hypothetical protein RR709_10635, partial [Ruthenibacterium sp.]
MYSLFVYDENFQPIGVVEDIHSLQWLSEYQSVGEVKLVVSATAKNRLLLHDGYRLFCTQQPESAIICETELTDDGKEAKLTVRAQLSAARWEHRVVMATENITKIESGILALIRKYRNGLPGITAAAKGFAASIDMQITWGSVLGAVMRLCAASTLGFREIFSAKTRTDTFEVYSGTDRTRGIAYNGYFGDDIDNLADIKIQKGSADFKNVAIVAGEGQGKDRTVVTVTLGNYTGERRRELFVDAKDISRTYQIATQSGTDAQGNPTYSYTDARYTDAAYIALLQARGMEKLL